uniref:Spu-4/1 n=1 Tax=Selaginella pulcherrima TaxID=81966 RepID=A0A0M4Q386_9TRAC|nr:Spu-4/1 [Selaginella pulcherrima]
MLPPSEEDMEILARDLAALEEEFRDAKSEAESLKALLAAETQCRQAAENLCASLEGDKMRLMKSQEEFLAQTIQELDYKSKFEVLWQEVNLKSEQDNAKQQEHERAVSTLQEKFQTMETELNSRISSLENQLHSKESSVIQLEQEIAQLHDSMDILNQNHEERRRSDQTEFQREITALRLELQAATQANHSLSKQLEKQQQKSLLEKTKLEAQIQELSSNWQVGALKQKLMKLRKENEDLKRRR